MEQIRTLQNNDDFLNVRSMIYIGAQVHNRTEIHPHWHERMEFLLMRKGELHLACGNEYMEIQPGDMVIISPNEIHAGQFVSDTAECLCLDFDLSVLKQMNDVDTNRLLDDLLYGRLRIQRCAHNFSVLNEQINRLHGY